MPRGIFCYLLFHLVSFQSWNKIYNIYDYQIVMLFHLWNKHTYSKTSSFHLWNIITIYISTCYISFCFKYERYTFDTLETSLIFLLAQWHKWHKKYSSIIETLKNSYHITAHQLSNVCTTRVIHMHISWWASAQQLICDQRAYLFQRHILYHRRTFFISLEDSMQAIITYLPIQRMWCPRKYSLSYEKYLSCDTPWQ